MIASYPNLLTVCLLWGIRLHKVDATALTPVAPPRFAEQPKWPQQDYYDEDGPPIVLDCKIVADRSVRILWLKDGKTITKNLSSWYVSNNNQTLTLDPPKASQTGQYYCLASNKAGNISHKGSIVIVARTEVTRPRVIQTDPPSQVVHATLGQNVTISCVFDIGGVETGLMDLEMDWIKNQTELNDTTHTTWDYASTPDYNQVFLLNITNLQASDYGDYECIGKNSAGNDSRLLAVLPPKPDSGPDHTQIIVFSSVGGVFLIGTIAMVTLLIRKYYTRSKYEHFDWPEHDTDRYDVPNVPMQYDVFVSYSSDDQDWVLNSLFKTMTSNRYEVCIDFKDFVPGMAISENILEAIYKSRKVIVVLSQNFMKSMWGQFELSQALNRAVMQRKDVLLLIRYDSCKVPAKLMGTTFLDWTSDEVRPHFWKRLFESVGEPGNYGKQGNQESENQNGGETEKQNGGVGENQNGGDSENNDGYSEKPNGSDMHEIVVDEKKLGDTTSKESDKVVAGDSDSLENTGSSVQALEREMKIIDVNIDKEMNSIVSDTNRLLENENDFIDIRQVGVKV